MTQEEQNRKFEELEKQYGLHGLEARIQKLDSVKAYYRRYPYDGYVKYVPEEEAYYLRDGQPDPMEQAIMNEEQDRYLAGLTEKEHEAVKLTVEGYKPRDIAKIHGQEHSRKWRWHKWAAKQKIKQKLEER